MDHSPSPEGNTRPATQDVSRIYETRKFITLLLGSRCCPGSVPDKFNPHLYKLFV